MVSGPVPHNGHLLRHFCQRVKVGEEDTCLVGRQGDENVPQTVHVRKANGLPDATEEVVTQPAY